MEYNSGFKGLTDGWH